MSRGTKGDPDGFSEFWTAYRVFQDAKRADAAAMWRRLKVDSNPAVRAEVLAGFERWRLSRQWQDGAVQHCHRWLKQERWKEDPLPASVKVEKGRDETPAEARSRVARQRADEVIARRRVEEAERERIAADQLAVQMDSWFDSQAADRREWIDCESEKRLNKFIRGGLGKPGDIGAAAELEKLIERRKLCAELIGRAAA